MPKISTEEIRASFLSDFVFINIGFRPIFILVINLIHL